MTPKPEKKEIVWREEGRTLTLTGIPVLELSLSRPQAEEKRLRGLNRYYEYIYRLWKKHWEREGYWQACADLAQQTAQSRPFRVWKASLSGQVLLDRDGLLSISMLAREVQGDGRTLEYRWGDTWRREDGSIVTLKELLPAKRGWKREVLRELEQAAQACRRQGVYLDGELEKPLRRWYSRWRFGLTEEGLEFYYPQCTLAPAVEGAVVLRVPMPDTGGQERKKDA